VGVVFKKCVCAIWSIEQETNGGHGECSGKDWYPVSEKKVGRVLNLGGQGSVGEVDKGKFLKWGG